MLQSIRTFFGSPRRIISLQNVVSHSPTGNVPESSITSLTPYFVTSISISSTTSTGSRVRYFGDQIRQKIDAGIPIIWSVWLGIVPETPALPQSSGGHMRLILGYDREGNVLYSDSWGAGHERKKMRLEDALLITTGLRTLAPRAN